MIKENNSSNIIVLIDYYEGAYGPTVRIDTQSIEAVIHLRDIFLKLAAVKVSEVSLHKIKFVKITNIKALMLKVVPEGEEHKKTLQLIQITPEGLIFDWCRSPEGWIDCAGLLDGIIKHCRPGHQYLTDETVDDALVEVVFSES